MIRESEVLIYLCAAVINGSRIDPDMLTGVDFDRLYRIAEYQQLTAVTAYALESLDINDPRFESAKNQAIWKEILFDEERARIEEELDRHRIWHMPLKGVILKEYYPEAGMRQMSDNDILFDASQSDEVRAIMLAADYTVNHFGTGHQDDYSKSPVYHFEMHRRLFASTMTKLCDYYDTVRQRLVRDEGSREGFHFRDEDFYIYMMAHLYKHYYWEGAGLRALLDVYVFLKHKEDCMDPEHIRQETVRAGIDGFEERMRDLAVKVYSNGRITDLTAREKKILEYFVYCGDFGTYDSGLEENRDRRQELAYLKRRVLLPAEVIKVSYPTFYKHKVLIPLLPVYRLISRWKTARYELSNLLRR